jgi:hypothetical protein
MKISRKTLGAIGLVTVGLTVVALARVPPQGAPEEAISGTITTTRIITQNTRLTGDVTCAVTGAPAPCIQFGASGITLNLNGFTMTGLADLSTGCADGPINQIGIDTGGRSDVTIQGPGLVQQFRGQGIAVRNNTTRAKIVSVTSSTNCNAGIILTDSSDSLVEGNFLVRNGNLSAACGGI